MAQTIALEGIISCSVFHFHEDGLIFRFHELSHSKAMHLLQSGVNLIYIRDLLGHADVSTTEIYARADEHFKRQALTMAYPSPTPEPETPAWQKDSDLLNWLKGLGK